MNERCVENLVVAVFRAQGAIVGNGNRLIADTGLTVALWQVLDALDRGGGTLPVAAIGRAMGLTRQSVQRSVNLLIDKNMVLFTINPLHKRAQLIVLTKAGRDALDTMNARVAGSIASILDRIPANEIDAARLTLTAFTDEQLRQLEQDA